MRRPIPNLFPGVKIILLFFFFFAVISKAAFAQPDYGKTYVNITKGINGGTVETGDILEIRATFVVRSGVYDSCAFYDAIPVGTTYVASSLKVLTNEGKVYKSFTDAFGDDCGFRSGSNIQINLGYNPTNAPATAYRRGRIQNTDRPSVFGGTCIMIASYRIKVTAAIGTSINVGQGYIRYKLPTSALTSVLFASNGVAISKNSSTCGNSIGANAIAAEFGGTFGSGKKRNRGTSTSVPAYIYAPFSNGSPQDYYYGVANNTSIQGAGYTTLNTWPKPDAAHRVFGVWDIIGDHTGATNPLLGNNAADTVANPNAGYMLVINASYKTDTAFSYTVAGLCPNTYYELSAWVRNICSRCGCDSTGKGAGAAGYIPTALGDSSGVYPNLTLGINGIDYYSSGDIKYTGEWIKKGFTYTTGPSQTSFTMTIRNNAPGGGGNDWAIDDITIATCTPTLTLDPSENATVCQGNQVDVSCKVRCFSPNYIYWLFEKSTDGGTTWNSTGTNGTGVPVLVSGEYEYTARYPSFLGTQADNMNSYRIRVASTAGNLSNINCSFSDFVTIAVLVNNCYTTLATDIISFAGNVKNNLTDLQWVTTNESANVTYEIERSSDRIHFSKEGIVSGKANPGTGTSYRLTDPEPLKGQTFYRVKLVNGNQYKYSKVIVVSANSLNFDVKSLVNPFDNRLSFDLINPIQATAVITILDNYGTTIKKVTIKVEKGLYPVNINNLDDIKSGAYTLHIQAGDRVINKRIIKLNR